jgi:hypothetical protein
MNRITEEATQTAEAARSRAPVVRARRSWHWSCPDCGRTQIAKRSVTHEAECSGCGKWYLVWINGPEQGK